MPCIMSNFMHACTGGIPIKYNHDRSINIASAPRETREFNGCGYVMEEAITGDYSLIKAWKGDTNGNLVFHATAQNFNPDCAKAGDVQRILCMSTTECEQE